METVNTSEEFVLNVCRKSFLSLWCYANPIKVRGKELCDILVSANVATSQHAMGNFGTAHIRAG